ncbi:Spo0E family sporulation regulatory protein-aspartic acid phosphatase [Clostridium weizhouense]|uniref:Spo0E family sporulation regulatory protein-aspartic acid phosphatase n=1 Tax=Clostridium weizhouense TaxID=2859781 RepID=A0ABS7AQ24_9CLOT|nr:Spo0E family sporulation regulatory protein-aspartic acid phosphatase [Clostridium weizhouense]MBW6410769.1 Spo0E family sporulation regulatory protein-aspartic acid phosphatase [Clostridium weizhouense]
MISDELRRRRLKLREELYKSIHKFGIDNENSLRISQEIDKIIVEEMKLQLFKSKLAYY